MSIELKCPWCGKKLRVKASRLGKKTKCPKCENVFTAPEDAPQPAAAPAASAPEPETESEAEAAAKLVAGALDAALASGSLEVRRDPVAEERQRLDAEREKLELARTQLEIKNKLSKAPDVRRRGAIDLPLVGVVPLTNLVAAVAALGALGYVGYEVFGKQRPTHADREQAAGTPDGDPAQQGPQPGEAAPEAAPDESERGSASPSPAPQDPGLVALDAAVAELEAAEQAIGAAGSIAELAGPAEVLAALEADSDLAGDLVLELGRARRALEARLQVQRERLEEEVDGLLRQGSFSAARELVLAHRSHEALLGADVLEVMLERVTAAEQNGGAAVASGSGSPGESGQPTADAAALAAERKAREERLYEIEKEVLEAYKDWMADRSFDKLRHRACEGTSKVECGPCGGSGNVFTFGRQGRVLVTCQECRGDGKLRCVKNCLRGYRRIRLKRAFWDVLSPTARKANDLDAFYDGVTYGSILTKQFGAVPAMVLTQIDKVEVSRTEAKVMAKVRHHDMASTGGFQSTTTWIRLKGKWYLKTVWDDEEDFDVLLPDPGERLAAGGGTGGPSGAETEECDDVLTRIDNVALNLPSMPAERREEVWSGLQEKLRGTAVRGSGEIEVLKPGFGDTVAVTVRLAEKRAVILEVGKGRAERLVKGDDVIFWGTLTRFTAEPEADAVLWLEGGRIE